MSFEPLSVRVGAMVRAGRVTKVKRKKSYKSVIFHLFEGSSTELI